MFEVPNLKWTVPFLFLMVGLLFSGESGVTLSAHGTSSNALSSSETHLIGQVNVIDLSLASEKNQIQLRDTSSLQGASIQLHEKEVIQKNSDQFVPLRENTKHAMSPSSEVVQSARLSLATNLVLEGAGGGTPNPCACTPPDPNLGVGPNHVFEMVNVAGIIYAKDGTLVKATFPLSGFFGLSGSMSDPQVFYDSASERWFASIIDITSSRIQLAVSTTNDPTGIFNLYSVAAGRNLPDQPFIAANDDKLVISANDFNSAGTIYLGVQYWILNKSDLVSGSSKVRFVTSAPDTTMFTLRPVRHLTPTSIFYMITNCIDSCVTDPQSTTSNARLLVISGTPPGTISVTTNTFPISTSIQPPNAQQAGTSTLLTTNDNRILSSVWESNTLWFTWSDSCIPTGDSQTRSCLHLVELTTSGTGTPSKLQDFDYSSKGEYLYYPALTLSQGQLAVVYGRSSTSTFPSLLATGRLPTDSVNILQSPVVIRSGTAPDTSSRYGDYFGAATDPTPSSSSAFWVAGEYRASSQSSLWNTAIAQIAPLVAQIPVSINSPGIIFQGINVTTTANMLVNTTNSTFSGTATVTAQNATSGTVLFTKTYSITPSPLRVEGSVLDALFLLSVPVTPYPLSVNLDVTVNSGTATTIVSVTRLVDIESRGTVDIVDAATLAAAFDSTPGSQNWNPQADIYAIGRVDIRDAAYFAFFFDALSFT